MKRESFDATAAYKEEIEPVLRELIELCQVHGVPLTAMMTYKVTVTPCAQCGDPDCTNTDERSDAAAAIYGSTARMTPLQMAIAELQELPEETRDKFVDVILLAAAAIDSGGSASVHLGVADDTPRPDARWN